MPTKNKRNKSRKTPNVYVQAQRERDELETRLPAADADGDVTASPTPENARGATEAAARPRASRLTQTTRSDVYAVSIPNEMRKMGILAAGLVVALVVFSVALG